jgi:hypothetical protein
MIILLINTLLITLYPKIFEKQVQKFSFQYLHILDKKKKIIQLIRRLSGRILCKSNNRQKFMADQINRSDFIRFVSFGCLGNTILKIPVDTSKKLQTRITREYNQITPHVVENVVTLSTILLTL